MNQTDTESPTTLCRAAFSRYGSADAEGLCSLVHAEALEAYRDRLLDSLTEALVNRRVQQVLRMRNDPERALAIAASRPDVSMEAVEHIRGVRTVEELRKLSSPDLLTRTLEYFLRSIHNSAEALGMDPGELRAISGVVFEGQDVAIVSYELTARDPGEPASVEERRMEVRRLSGWRIWYADFLYPSALLFVAPG